MIKNIEKYIKAEYIAIIMLALLSFFLLFLLWQKEEKVMESAEITEIQQLQLSGEEYKRLEEENRKKWENTVWAKRCNETRLKEKINSGSTVIDCTKNLEKWASYNNQEQGL